MSSVVKRLVPLLDRVVVQKVKQEMQTKAGIFLPESAKGPMNTAMVVAVGPGKYTKEGLTREVQVKVGDTVVVPEYGGYNIKLDGEELNVYREEDLIAILKKE